MSREIELAQIQNQIQKEENEELKQQIRDLQEKIRKQDNEMEALVDTLDENAKLITELRENIKNQAKNIKGLREATENDRKIIADLMVKNRLLRDENVNDISRVDEFIANLKSMNVFQFVEFVNKYEEDMGK